MRLVFAIVCILSVLNNFIVWVCDYYSNLNLIQHRDQLIFDFYRLYFTRFIENFEKSNILSMISNFSYLYNPRNQFFENNDLALFIFYGHILTLLVVLFIIIYFIKKNYNFEANEANDDEYF